METTEKKEASKAIIIIFLMKVIFVGSVIVYGIIYTNSLKLFSTDWIYHVIFCFIAYFRLIYIGINFSKKYTIKTLE
jgi:Co/Zn/Cd efflux system component